MTVIAASQVAKFAHRGGQPLDVAPAGQLLDVAPAGQLTVGVVAGPVRKRSLVVIHVARQIVQDVEQSVRTTVVLTTAAKEIRRQAFPGTSKLASYHSRSTWAVHLNWAVHLDQPPANAATEVAEGDAAERVRLRRY